MSSSLSDLSKWASIAQAAYAFFDSTQSRRLALIGTRTGDFAATEADRFLGTLIDPNSSTSQGIELRNHQPNDWTGFSGSVFFDRSTNRYVLSIRGTEGLSDITEDTRRIGLQGYAGDQLVSLYRYYRKLTTPAGQPVQYSASEISLLQAIRKGPFIDPTGLVLGVGRSAVLRADLASDKGETPLAGSGSRVIPLGTQLVVTGHSLGGHLALLFGRLFPEATDRVVTFNAPGISPIGEFMMERLGIAQIDAARVTNLSAVMGNEFVSHIWSKPGANIGIFTEPGSRLHEHSIIPFADSLALYDAFAVLSPRLTTGEAEIGQIMAAASPYVEDSLEITLDNLRSVLGSGDAPTLIARAASDLDARDSYYKNLYAMLDGRESGRDYQIESLVGKSERELAVLAESDVSVRFALHELNPFAAKNGDYSEFEDSFSGQWLVSRAEWLAATMEGNLLERPFGLSSTSDNVLFRDIDLEQRYAFLDGVQDTLAHQGSALADRAQLSQFLDSVAFNRSIVFGSESPDVGDSIAGLSGGDRLFGSAGDDSLDGAGGEDYLEGGSGGDTLVGGAGNDVLDGGEGEDRLEGGPGSDDYLWDAELDADTIVDHDGLVYAGSTLLTGGFSDGDGHFLSSDGQFSYTFSGDLSAGGTLVINGSLRVEDFRDGDLGIRLFEGIDRTASMPIPVAELLGDYIYVPIPISETEFIYLDEYRNPLPAARVASAPGKQDTFQEFPGTPGNTHFVMGGGNDLIQDFMDGDDWIELGSGDDGGFGSIGNDVVEGGTGRDFVAGGRGDDVLYAGATTTLEADLDDSAVALLGNGGDLLSGGDGDDLMFGDPEWNLIEGGAGRDRIFGGAGNDWIGSDAAHLSQREVYLVEDGVYYGGGLGDLTPNYSVTYVAESNLPVLAIYGSAGAYGPEPLDGTESDADEIDAGSGDDVVFSGGGDDLVLGGAGDDYLDTGMGADTVFGGDGNDRVWAVWDDIADYVDAGEGDDNVLAGGGDNILIGGGGDDTLAAGGGNNIFLGGDGRDFLVAGSGSAILDGGADDDLLIAGTLGDDIRRVRFGKGSGLDVLQAVNGSVVVEMAGDVLPDEVSVSSAQHLVSALDPNLQNFEIGTGVLVSIGTDGDGIFLADITPSGAQAAISIEFADGTIWDGADIDALAATAAAPQEPSAAPPAPEPQPAAAPPAIDVPSAPSISAPVRAQSDVAAAVPVAEHPQANLPIQPQFAESMTRLDALLKAGDTNLGESYADAVRAFEARRLGRGMAFLPPPPTAEEVETWNNAMHDWHARNSGFSEIDIGGNDDSWTMGWGLPGAGNRSLGGGADGRALELANPNAASRLGGAASVPALSEGLRNLG